MIYFPLPHKIGLQSPCRLLFFISSLAVLLGIVVFIVARYGIFYNWTITVLGAMVKDIEEVSKEASVFDCCLLGGRQ